MPMGRFCTACDYDLAASEGPVCPECGRAFSPADPRSFRPHSRRSLRGRWRRWRWLVVLALLLTAAWPRGWSFTRIGWIDPSGLSTVEAETLVIGRPWWLGGWYGPIVWGRTSGAVKTPPKPARGMANHVEFTDDQWLCDSPWPWRAQFLGRGKLAVVGPGFRKPPTDAQWRADIEVYVRRICRGTGEASAKEGSMSIVAPAAPWKSDAQDGFTTP